MSWQALLEPEIRTFIADHEQDDVAALALKKPPKPDWPYKLILDQIKSRQKARKKLPDWFEDNKDLIFPAPNVIEQASSIATARYKASLVQGQIFCDLTAGAGVDSWALLDNFPEGICVDADEHTAALLAHNLSILNEKIVRVHHAKAETFIAGDMPDVDLVMIDPQRRDDNRKGKYRLEDCSPNILDLLPVLHEKAQKILIKTSPMLDIDQGIAEIGSISAVKVVEYRGECKELLFLSEKMPKNTEIEAVSIDNQGKVVKSLAFTREEEAEAQAICSMPQKYLFEPGPAFQKSGAFQTMAVRFGVSKLHAHTHLYTSDDICADFPGRVFEVLDILPVDAKAVKNKKVNLSVRNFPERAETLMKRLKIKSGGEDTIFACTLINDQKALVLSRPIDRI